MTYVPVAQRTTAPTQPKPAVTPSFPLVYKSESDYLKSVKADPIVAPAKPTFSINPELDRTSAPLDILPVFKDVGQSIARNIGSAAMTVAGASKEGKFVEPLTAEDFQSPFAQALFENVFGKDVQLKPIEQRIAEAEPEIDSWKKGLEEISKTPGLSPREKFVTTVLANMNTSHLAFTGIMGSVGLDLTPFGGLEKNAYRALVAARTEGEALAALSKMGVADDLAREFAPDVVRIANEAEAKTLFNHIADLQLTTKTAAPAAGYVPLAERSATIADRVGNIIPTEITPALKSFAEVAKKERDVQSLYQTMKTFDDALETARLKGFKNLEELYKSPDMKGSLKPNAYEALKTQENKFFGESYKGTPKSFYDLARGVTPKVDKRIVPTRLRANALNQEERNIPTNTSVPARDELASLDESAKIAERPTVDLPGSERATLSQEGKKALEGVSELKSLKRGMSASEAATRDAIAEARMQRDMFTDIARDMPGRELAKYESKHYPGQLPEILGKTPQEIKNQKLRPGKFNQSGDQILDDALGYKDHGWNTIEDAEKALQDYKAVRQQARDMHEVIQSRIKDLKKIQAEGKNAERKSVLDDLVHYVNERGAERTQKVQSVQDYFKLTNKEMTKILRNERDLSLMNDGEFDSFMKRIQGKATEAFMRAQTKADLEATIFEKELVKTDNIRKAMHLPKIQNMTTQQMKDFNEIMQKFKKGDEFLGVRQIETVKNTDLKGVRTKREALERLLIDINKLRERKGMPPVTMAELDAIHVSPLDHIRYDVALARQNPLYELMVHEVHKSILNGDAAVMEVRDKVNDLFEAARASRERGFLDRAIPFDMQIFRWLEATDADKLKLADDMTDEELKAAGYVRDWYAEARDYLLQQKVLKRSIKDYVTHIRRGFLEAWREEGSYVAGQVSGEKPGALKRAGNGLVAAFKELWDAHKLEEATFNILNEKTGDVLPLEKFFQFSMSRTGELVPSKNVAKAFLKYAETFEKKKMLDSVIPKLDIYVHSLTPKKLTPRGLEFDDSLKRFFKTWMNTKKGRPTTTGFNILGLQFEVKPGDRVDWTLRMGVALTRILDLGINIPVGLASNLGAQVATYRGLGEKAYAIGNSRLATKQGREIVARYENLVGRPIYKKVMDQSASLGDSLYSGFFGLFSFADRKARQAFLLGSMSPEEYKAGKVGIDRLTDIQMALGRHLPLENMESIAGKTSPGRVGTQYRSWAVPILSSTLDDLAKAGRAIRNGDAAYLKSPEFFELLRTAIVSTAVGVGAHGLLTDNRPKNEMTFAEKVAAGAARDALSLIGALTPNFWTKPGRLYGFVSDLGTALTQVLSVERNQEGDMTGLNTLGRTLTPTAIKQFIPPKETTTSKKGGMPGLPKLPALPKLPKIGG